MNDENKKRKTRVLSEEHRRKLSEAAKGRVLSPETRSKISESVKSRPLTVTPGWNKIPHEFIDGTEHKRCGICETYRPLLEFGKYSKTWDQLHYNCKSCNNQAKKEYLDSRPDLRKKQSKDRMIAVKACTIYTIKYAGGKCLKCGLEYKEGMPTGVFDFHHRDPSTKLYSVSERRATNFDLIKDEVDKCDLLCKNCHAMIPLERRKKYE